MLRYTLPAACPLSLLRADNSPHLTAVRSVEAVPDDPAADSLDRADAADVPIVATSANAFAEDVKRSLASGMNAHVSKPIDPEKLAKVLAKVMR